MGKFLFTTLTILLLGAFNASALDSKQEAAIHREKALKWVEAKNWESARDEANKAAKLDPGNADNWLILGTIEQRLERKPEAIEAFRKYLSMNPPEEKAKEVRGRIAEMEVAKETQEKVEEAEAGEKGVDMSSPGFGFWYSPKYSIGWEMGSTINSSFGTGITSPNLMFGFRYADGTIPNTIYEKKGVSTPVTNMKHTVYELEFAWSFILLKPFTSMGPLSFAMPLYFGMPLTTYKGGPEDLTSFGWELGTGVGMRYHTKSGIVPEITALYHLGSLQFGFTEKTEKLKTSAGQEIGNNTSGLEIRVAINFWLWGKTEKEKAAEAAARQELEQKLQQVK